MKINQVLSGEKWEARAKMVADTPDVVDVGVGNELTHQSGMERLALGALYVERIEDLIDGGADLTYLDLSDGRRLTVYVRRRGRQIDIGTREDFHDMGAGAICDLFDEKLRENGN